MAEGVEVARAAALTLGACIYSRPSYPRELRVPFVSVLELTRATLSGCPLFACLLRFAHTATIVSENINRLPCGN